MEAQANNTLRGTLILIAEDSPTQAEQLSFMLQQYGCRTMTAANGRIALEMAAQHRPALLITDVVMPEMDGYQLCSAIKSNPELRDIPVLMVTSLAGMQDIAKSLECGADNFVRKPYDFEMLLSRINYILLNRELRQGRKVEIGMELMLDGKRHFINSEREQIVDLLVSTYEEAVHMNEQLAVQQREIARSNHMIRTLYRIARTLSVANTMQDITDISLQGLGSLPPFQSGWVWLIDLDGMRLHVGPGLTSTAIAYAGSAACKAACEALLAAGDAGLQRMDDPALPHVMVPLLAGQRCMGVLCVLMTQGSQLGGEEEKALIAIAGQMSVAVERVNLMIALAQRATQLELANKDLESFSYSVSHDLRAPLRAVSGFARMLTEQFSQQLGSEGQRLLAVVTDNAAVMNNLIDSLLTFSRLGRVTVSTELVDMTALVQSVYRMLCDEDPLAGKATLHLSPVPACRGDPALLRQIWANLLSNAVKYAGKQPQPLVEVSGQTEGGEHIYRVKDNGVGFDMHYYDKLFGVFQRLHGADEFPGTGIGLANIQRIIKRHGGRVWAESEVGKGATFYFSLPT